MSDTVSKTIPPDLSGLRLDQALAKMFPEFSRSRLKTWIKKGLVTVDGKQLRPRDSVCGGQDVSMTPVAERSVTSKPEPIDLDVIYEDDDVLVVNKPAGLVVHPGSGNLHGTLMNGLLHRVPELEALPRAGIVHRLDKDTSGLLMVGKNLASHTALVRALAERAISRYYMAICNGVLTGGGTVDAPMARHPVDRLRMSVQERGKPAITHFRVRERFRAHTLVDVELETGRTHQIRVHFAYRRNALVGDPVYGGRLSIPAGSGEALQAGLRRFRRQALHAAKLCFAHPVSEAPLSLEVEPPADFRELLALMRADVESAS